jgi:hypothetical protein
MTKTFGIESANSPFPRLCFMLDDWLRPVPVSCDDRSRTRLSAIKGQPTDKPVTVTSLTMFTLDQIRWGLIGCVLLSVVFLAFDWLLTNTPVIGTNRVKPSKPLCRECRKVVRRAKAIDVKYVDVSNGYIDHPHMGALDEDGMLGYVPDVTKLQQNPPSFNVSSDELDTICNTADYSSLMISGKIRVVNAADQMVPSNNAVHRKVKILCFITTISTTHYKIPTILQTWGYVV